MADFMNFSEAAQFLGVGLPKLRDIVRREKLTVKENPINRRVKLLLRVELEKLLDPNNFRDVEMGN